MRRGSRTYPKPRLDRRPKTRQTGTRKCDPPGDSGGIKCCSARFPENTGRFKQHQRNRLRRIPGTFRISDPYHRQGRQPFCALMLTVAKEHRQIELALFQAFEQYGVSVDTRFDADQPA